MFLFKEILHYIYVYMCVCVCMCVYIYIYIYIYIVDSLILNSQKKPYDPCQKETYPTHVFSLLRYITAFLCTAH